MTVSDDTRNLVRARAHFACEYCGVQETDAGDLLTIDHFHPTSRGGDDGLENLVYCCVRCNQYKRDYWPESPSDPSLWNPRQEQATTHFVALDDGVVEALTEKGNFSISLLHLNRPALVAYRQEKLRAFDEAQWIERYRQFVAVLEQLVEQQSQLIREQRSLLAEQQKLLRRLFERLDE